MTEIESKLAAFDDNLASLGSLFEQQVARPNGKINRRALPVPGLDRPVLAVPYAAPRDLTESTLTAIWMEVLQLERIGINDRFLDLGGDSLRAIRILNRAKGCFGIELFISDLIQTETIAQMAELITTRNPTGSGDATVRSGKKKPQ